MPSALCRCRAQAAGPQLAEKGLQNTLCPPAIPWTKARKCNMPWLPLMHFSSSHRSALCQFSSFAVRESAEHGIGGCGQEQPPGNPSRPHQHPPASLMQAARGQQCCEPGDQQIAWKWEFRTGLWDARVVFARMQYNPLMPVTVCPATGPLPLANAHLYCLRLGLALNLLQLEDKSGWRKSSNAFRNGTGASLDELLIFLK